MRLWLDRSAPELSAAGAGRVWLDRSPALVLAVCRCGWRAPATDPAAAWAAAAAHAAEIHADADAAAQARKNRCRVVRIGEHHP